MSLASDLSKVVSTMRQEGSRKLAADIMLALRVRAQRPFDHRFDQTYGLHTEGIALLPDLTIESANRSLGSEYVPSPGRLVEHALSRLPIAPKDFTFVDFGSGKGRILLRASMRGFRRVVGIEFASELYALSKQNVASFARRFGMHAPIDVYLTDAADFDIPGGKCVFFFYNPFRKSVMAKVLANIAASYRVNHQKFYIIHLALVNEAGNDADANRRMIEQQMFMRRCPYPRGLDSIWHQIQFGSFALDVYETHGGDSGTAADPHSRALVIAR